MQNLVYAGFTQLPKVPAAPTQENIIIDDVNAGKEAALIATARMQQAQINALSRQLNGEVLSAKDALIVDLTLLG